MKYEIFQEGDRFKRSEGQMNNSEVDDDSFSGIDNNTDFLIKFSQIIHYIVSFLLNILLYHCNYTIFRINQ